MEFHICKFYRGKIKDVTIREWGKTVHCRRCYEELEEWEVDPQTLSLIKTKFFGSGGKLYDE